MTDAGRRELSILAALGALGATLRFASLDLQSFGHDEAVTAGRVLQPGLTETVERVVDGERSPPLYYLLAWGWAKIFGLGEVGLRSLSALIGTLTVPAAWLAGRELASHRAGLGAAALVAVSPYLIWYSQEARSYALLVLFSVLALALLARALRRPEGSAPALWALSSAGALLSHYFAAFVIAPQAVLLLAAWLRARAGRARTMIAVAAVAVVGMVLLPLALTQEGEGRRNAFAERPLVERIAEAVLDIAASEEPDPFAGDWRVDVVQGSAGVLLALLVIGAAFLLRRFGSAEERRAGALAGGIGVAGICLPAALAVAGLDFFNPRNMIGAAAPILIFVAIGFGGRDVPRLAPAMLAATCAAMLAVVGAVTLSSQMQRPDWRAVAEAIGSSEHTRVLVVNANGDDPLSLYLERARRFKLQTHPSGVRACEVLALSTSYRVSAPPGFRLAARRGMAPRFILWRFRASRPRTIRPRVVAGDSVLEERSVSLIQPRRLGVPDHRGACRAP